MLNEKKIQYNYREYVEDPLSEDEIRSVLKKLGLQAKDVIRSREKIYKEMNLTSEESDEILVPLMAQHPTLLQRPIGIVGNKAAVGRPPENLLELL